MEGAWGCLNAYIVNLFVMFKYFLKKTMLNRNKHINKRPMGHIAHLRKQFKSMNTYDYIITLIERRKKTLLTLWELFGSSFEQTWIPFIQGCLVQSLVEIGQMVLKKIYKFRQYIFAISLLSPLGKGPFLFTLSLNLRNVCLHVDMIWLFFVVTEVHFSVVYLQLYIFMKPDYLFILLQVFSVFAKT